MKEPTRMEIAESWALWQDYVDPDGVTTEEDFEEMTLEKKVEIIKSLEDGSGGVYF